jgi:hypothetical protein
MKLKAYPYIYTGGDPDYRKFVMQPYSSNFITEWFDGEIKPSHWNPKIIDDYISECYRMGVKLYWKEKILDKFPYSKISSPNGSAEYYQSTMNELDKPLPLVPKEYYELIEMGYVPNAPSNDANEIDNKGCENAKCNSCGHKGLIYFPMTKFKETYLVDSYIAFAICPVCRKEEEI